MCYCSALADKADANLTLIDNIWSRFHGLLKSSDIRSARRWLTSLSVHRSRFLNVLYPPSCYLPVHYMVDGLPVHSINGLHTIHTDRQLSSLSVELCTPQEIGTDLSKLFTQTFPHPGILFSIRGGPGDKKFILTIVIHVYPTITEF